MLQGHTPGPWTADNLGGISADTGRGYPMLVAITQVDPMTGNNRADNARLIAAAPDMLDMLYRVLPFIEGCEADDAYKPGAVRGLIKDMMALIAKAEQG